MEQPEIYQKLSFAPAWQATESKLAGLEQLKSGAVKTELAARANITNYRANFPFDDATTPAAQWPKGRPEDWTNEEKCFLPKAWRTLDNKVTLWRKFDDGATGALCFNFSSAMRTCTFEQFYLPAEFAKAVDSKIDVSEDFDYKRVSWKGWMVANLTRLTQITNLVFMLGRKVSCGMYCRRKPFPKGGTTEPRPGIYWAETSISSYWYRILHNAWQVGGGKLFKQFQQEIGNQGELVVCKSRHAAVIRVPTRVDVSCLRFRRWKL
eukprot:SAG11_NODE_93_length_17080_cov_10.504093_11_plen_265_part_00